MSIPEAYGGGGADPLTYCLFIEELSRGDANVRSIMSVHLGLVAGSIDRWGTEQQKQHWLPRMATGEVLGCFGLTEPDHGSNPADLRATAQARPGGGWRISGRKIFITNGSIAQLALVMARTGGPGAKGVSAFLVPTDHDGFTANPLHGKLGLRSCDTAELVLDGVEVGPEALLGGEGNGIKVALSALDDGRMSIAASCTGIGQSGARHHGRLLDPARAVRQADRRPPAGAGDDRRLRGRRRRRPGCSPGRSPTSRPAASATRWRPRRPSCSRPRRRCGSRTAASRCTAATGTSMSTRRPSCLRDARVTTLYEGTSQVQKLLIGRALTGVTAF